MGGNGQFSKLRMAPAETAEELRQRLEREQRAQQLQREDALENAEVDLSRVGSVPYLNAVPLTRGLEDRIVMAHPSRLAELLEAGALDAALVSVTEVLQNDRYDVLDGIAIASLGEVKSVLLAHRQPLGELREVYCDAASRTSVNLLKVLLAERGLTPEFPVLGSHEEAAAHEAVMLIGDQAIEFSRAGHPHQIWDLGAAWYELTGLPFVYAVWALRRATDTTAIRRLLREARDFGMDTLEHIIRNRTDFDLDFRKDYLGWHVHYHLGVDERRGLALFASLMRKHGLGPVYDPRYVV
jgi:chorismate dehydratase